MRIPSLMMYIVHDEASWKCFSFHLLSSRCFFFLFSVQLFQQFSTHARGMHKYINNFSLLTLPLVILIHSTLRFIPRLLVCTVWFWMRYTRTILIGIMFREGKFSGTFLWQHRHAMRTANKRLNLKNAAMKKMSELWMCK